MPAPEQAPVEYPILGEPLFVEFINTLYIGPTGTFDFLATVDLASGWFAALEPRIPTDVARLDERTLCDLIELRSAIRAVSETSDLTRVTSSIRILESAANRSPARISLTCTEPSLLDVQRVHDLCGLDGTISLLAHAAIHVAAREQPGRVLICDRPACNMRYLQQHRRRRYCNPACANADRQARFQQRRRN